MADCDLCGRPQPDTAHVCARCAGRTRAALCRLAELAPELEVTIARQARTGCGGTGADRHPLPVDLAAAEQAWAVANTVSTWVRHCVETRGVEPPACRPGREVIAPAAAWLAEQLEWLRHQPEASEAVDELGDAATLAVRIVDRRAPRVIVGLCGCGSHVYGTLGRDWAACRGCGTTYDVRASREALRRHLDDQLMTAAEIATLALHLGLSSDRQRTRKLINVWASRGVIAAHPGAAGAAHRFGEVIGRLSRSATERSGATVTAQRAG